MNKSFDLSYYIVAFIDYMGQKSLLAELAKTDLDDVSEERLTPRLQELLDKTFNAIDELRNSLQVAANLANNYRPDTRVIAPEKRQYYEDLAASAQIKLQTLSDAVIFHARLEHPLTHIGINSIFRILFASTMVMPGFRAQGKPLRGGIDIHWAGEIREGEIYGPALYNAYHLENEISKYPRITVGWNLIERLKSLIYSNPCDQINAFTQKLAKRSFDLIGRDEDGIPILDYLGKGYRDILTLNDDKVPEEIKHILIESYNKASSLLERFKQEENPEIIKYYERLIAYYQSRAPVWAKDGIKFA